MVKADTLYLFPALTSALGGSIYTREIGQCYTSGLLCRSQFTSTLLTESLLCSCTSLPTPSYIREAVSAPCCCVKSPPLLLSPLCNKTTSLKLRQRELAKRHDVVLFSLYLYNGYKGICASLSPIYIQGNNTDSNIPS